MDTRETIFSAATLVTSIAACLLVMTSAALVQSSTIPTYAVDEISVNPEPPVAGTMTELCAVLQNPTAASITIQIEFGVAELSIGAPFTSVGTTLAVVPAGGKTTSCINWTPSLPGPWSIQVTLSKSGSPDQFYQRNIVFEDSLVSGVAHARAFKVGNPTGSTATVSLGMVPHLSGWSLELSQDVFPNMAPGSVQTGSITVTPPAGLPADGSVIVDVEGYAGGTLLGGFRMVCGSGSSTSTTTSVPSSTTTSLPISTTTTTAGNTAPTAFFEVAPSTGTTETEFFVDASCSNDAEDFTQDLLVLWDWETDGTWDTPPAPEKTAVHFYPAPGTYTITLLVEDTGGLTDTAAQQVIVVAANDEGNTPPEASFTVGPSEGGTATVFTVDASSSTDAQTTPERLQIRWDWESDGMWDTDFTTVKAATHLFDRPDIYLITLEVADEGGLTAIATRQVLVVSGEGDQEGDNTPPHAVLYAEPPDGDTGTEFTFTAIDSTDAEDPADALIVRWDFVSDGIWDTDFNPDKVALVRYEIPGLYTCTVEIMDTGGLTDQASVEVMVHEPGVCPCELLVEKEQLGTLRRFRDEVLTQSKIGRLLLRSYYRHRQGIVNILTDYPSARAVARNLLKAMMPVFEQQLIKEEGPCST